MEMSPLEELALARAYELSRVLGELTDRPEHGEGSCVADAWDRMEDVIGMLEPEEDEPPRVRLVFRDGEEVRQ
jgi:hypothetical protein